MTSNSPGRLKFDNFHKEFVNWLKAEIAPVPVSRVLSTPAHNGRKVVVFQGGGSRDETGVFGVVRMNILVYGGNTWEKTEDFALEIDSVINGFNSTTHQTNIIQLSGVFPPTPSGDPDGTQIPVYSIACDLLVSAHNITL